MINEKTLAEAIDNFYEREIKPAPELLIVNPAQKKRLDQLKIDTAGEANRRLSEWLYPMGVKTNDK